MVRSTFIQMQMGIYWNLLFEYIRSKADRFLFSRKVFEKCSFHRTFCNWCYAFKWHVFLVLRIFNWHFEDFITHNIKHFVIYWSKQNLWLYFNAFLCWTMQMHCDEMQNINASLMQTRHISLAHHIPLLVFASIMICYAVLLHSMHLALFETYKYSIQKLIKSNTSSNQSHILQKKFIK